MSGADLGGGRTRFAPAGGVGAKGCDMEYAHMEYAHVSVLADEVIDGLNIRRGGVYVDGTLGGGGHAALICERLEALAADTAGSADTAWSARSARLAGPADTAWSARSARLAGSADTASSASSDFAGTIIGIDRDEEAIAAAMPRLAGYGCRKMFVRSEFDRIKTVLAGLGHGLGRENGLGEPRHELGLEAGLGPGIEKIDGALLDLGVSSRQLDTPARGFSYMADAPLDMRMSDDGMLTAHDVVNGYAKEELARIIKAYGEERWASRIASFIDKGRKEKPIDSTGELVQTIKAAIPASARRDGPHPAKRTFQAIRIEVNDELGQIERAVDEFIDVLRTGGRLAVITFHSLEDRIVKAAFAKRENPCICPPGIPVCACGRIPDAKRVNKKPILPSADEVERNPRARSAKLRIIEKL